MASTPFVFQADSGLTLSVKFEADAGTGTPAASYSATEKTTAKGWYEITVTQALEGTFFWHAEDGSANIVANGIADLTDDTDTYFGYDPVGSRGYYPDWNSAWAAEIENAVWDAVASGHTDPLTYGLLFAQVETRTADISTIDGKVDTIDTNLDSLITTVDTIDANTIVAKDQATIAAANTQK